MLALKIPAHYATTPDLWEANPADYLHRHRAEIVYLMVDPKFGEYVGQEVVLGEVTFLSFNLGSANDAGEDIDVLFTELGPRFALHGKYLLSTFAPVSALRELGLEGHRGWIMVESMQINDAYHGLGVEAAALEVLRHRYRDAEGTLILPEHNFQNCGPDFAQDLDRYLQALSFTPLDLHPAPLPPYYARAHHVLNQELSIDEDRLHQAIEIALKIEAAPVPQAAAGHALH